MYNTYEYMSEMIPLVSARSFYVFENSYIYFFPNTIKNVQYTYLKKKPPTSTCSVLFTIQKTK